MADEPLASGIVHRRHPLAIDLLDYVEESRLPSITLHLRSCRSCRQGVWNICGDDDVRRELFADVFAHRPDLGDRAPA